MTKKQTKRSKIVALMSKGLSSKAIAEKLRTSVQYVYTIRYIKKAEGAQTKAKTFIARGRRIHQDHKGQTPISAAKKPLVRHDLPGLIPKANDVQVGGEHYKNNKIQLWDAINDWELGFLSGNVVKYVTRWKATGNLEDLRKARHCLDKLIEA